MASITTTPGETVRRETSTNRASLLWLLQVFTGGLLIVVLGLHMVAHHFVVEEGLRNYQQVLDYVANPLVFAVEIAFVIVATVHSVIGIRAILFDMGPGESMRRVINTGLTLLGAATIVYGIWLAFALQALAN